MRILIQVVLLVAALTLSAGAQQPNVLLILSDDHSVPHLGCYASKNCRRFNITPNLDAFAAEGMRFNRAYTAAPQCAPSRISIFAGRSPVGLGVTRFAQPPRGDVRFFTDVLRANGYWAGLDGRHQHLDGRARESAHIDEVLKAEGMQNLQSRFDHFVRRAGTKGDNLEKVPDRFNAALDKVPDGKDRLPALTRAGLSCNPMIAGSRCRAGACLTRGAPSPGNDLKVIEVILLSSWRIGGMLS